MSTYFICAMETVAVFARGTSGGGRFCACYLPVVPVECAAPKVPRIFAVVVLILSGLTSCAGEEACLESK